MILALLPLLAGYDETVSNIAALYSSAAYCWPHKVKKWDLTPHCASISNFSVSATFNVSSSFFSSVTEGFAYTGVDHDRKWVVGAFKGTNDTLDWVTDFWGAEFDFGPCVLHGAHTAAHTPHPLRPIRPNYPTYAPYTP
jgi:hypothetical protein